jgi:uncharacterized protein (DUF2225 family)
MYRELAEHLNFNRGNALKYVWRHQLKSVSKEDLQKAAWYIRREIEREGKLDPSQYAKPQSNFEAVYDVIYDYYMNNEGHSGFMSFIDDIIFGHDSDLNDALRYVNNLIEDC